VLAASAVSSAKAVAIKTETNQRNALAGNGKSVALEVDATALPGGNDYLGEGGLDAFVGVADHQLGPE
jgi:hypothetical protein